MVHNVNVKLLKVRLGLGSMRQWEPRKLLFPVADELEAEKVHRLSSAEFEQSVVSHLYDVGVRLVTAKEVG